MMEQDDQFEEYENINKPYGIKNIYNVKKEDVIVQDDMNINTNSRINFDNNEQVNIYIENSDLNKKTYNCYTCNIQIYNYSFFRYHFKSEWHKYNLKRKLLNLSAINELTFNEKVSNLKKIEDGNEKEKNKKDKNGSSNDHKKKENNKNKNNNNGNKQKKDKFSNNGNNNNTSGAKKVIYATTEDCLLKANVSYDNPLVCFFDNRIFNTIEENIKHMNENYTFYIPDIKFVTNLKKIILTIGKKIYEENICIYCLKYFKSVKALQSHMVCKSHTKLHSNFFSFIEKYYDFSKTYVDLLNKYIANKEDKELVLCMLHKNKNNLKKTINCEKKETKLTIKEGESENSERKLNDNQNNISHENYNAGYFSSDHKETSIKLKASRNKSAEPITKYNDISDNYNSDHSDDYKVKEEELSKSIDHNRIYEVLEQFGYIKPELNEYNNLILPDGSEAINRKLAYIFKQKLPLENRESGKCDKIDVLKKKKENTQHYRKYKYYVDVMKKYNLDLNVKTNNLNKYYKSESIFFL
ncbi:zinc finger protein, putative [Plasmodium vinckei lentum]|uniref:Zinc finger protein, putative n=1 Tax=Plasmodium vinckei lentum TaxID=138297 RepID=A0A6V7S3D1_PLAVN|nr:zinc finger protein, putative [Plasmodium vinckei lentum]